MMLSADGNLAIDLVNGDYIEMGTDTSADELDNPADCQIDTRISGNKIAKVIILCVGDITWETSGDGEGGANTDFLTDNGIPAFTDGTSETVDSLIYHTIPSGSFSTTMSNAIGVPFVEDWETGADIKYKLTGTGGAEDTGWLDCGVTPEISSFTAFTAEPDTLIVKLVQKTTSPTASYPSIKGFVVKAT